MFIRIKAIDGKYYESDKESREEMEAENPPQNYEDILRQVTSLLDDLNGLDSLTIPIHGHKRIFNPANIIWTEIVEDD